MLASFYCNAKFQANVCIKHKIVITCLYINRQKRILICECSNGFIENVCTSRDTMLLLLTTDTIIIL